MKKRTFVLVALISFICTFSGLFYTKTNSFAQPHGDAAIANSCLDAIHYSPAELNASNNAALLLNAGIRCYRQREYELANQAWQEALKVYRVSDERSQQILVLGNLGILHQELGQYSAAIDFFDLALEELQRYNSGDIDAQAKLLRLLSRTYASVGRLEEGITYLEQALNLVKSTANLEEQVTILTNLGSLYFSLGAYGDAHSYYQQGFEVAQKTDNTLVLASLLGAMGRLEQVEGNLEQAVENFEESLAIALDQTSIEYEQRTLVDLCLAHRELLDYATAFTYCEANLQLALETNNLADVARAYSNLGFVHFSTGDFETAEDYAKESVKNYEKLFENINDDSDSQVALGDTLITYNLLQRILVAQENYTEALVIAEKGRAKASLNLMSQRFDSDLSLFDTNASLTLSDIQKTAKDHKATIVEYSLILESYLNHGRVRGATAEIYIWVIQPSGDINFRKVPIKSENKALQRLIFQLQDSIGIRNRGGLVLDVDPGIDQQDQLKELYGLLIEPIENLLPDDPTDQVIIVPQRQLFSIPFAALQDESGRYLIEQHTLSTTPSAQILQFTQQQRLSKAAQPRSAPLILGNPTMPEVRLSPDGPAQILSSLPGAEREAIDIAQLLNTSALVGDQATETAIKQKLPDAQLIHMATHGLLEYGRPEDSGVLDIPGAIALTPDDQEDGLLTAAEISNMDLQADLVVLSACDTGQGRVTDDGVIGLSRSFMTAGVPSTVVSLWAVPDAPTAQLMTEFYRQRQGGHNKAQALRQAMVTTMESHPDPRDWAAFLLIGETE